MKTQWLVERYFDRRVVSDSIRMLLFHDLYHVYYFVLFIFLINNNHMYYMFAFLSPFENTVFIALLRLISVN